MELIYKPKNHAIVTKNHLIKFSAYRFNRLPNITNKPKLAAQNPQTLYMALTKPHFDK